MQDEHFKVQCFVLSTFSPSLRRSSEIVQHLEEYFSDMRNGFAAARAHRGSRGADRAVDQRSRSCAGMFPAWPASSSPEEIRMK